MKRAMILAALLLLGLAVAKSFGAMDRSHRDARAFFWTDVAPDEGWIHVRNTNGSIRIEESDDDSVSVLASTSWKGTPEDVGFVVNSVDGSIYICALRGGGSEEDCDADSYRNQDRSWLAQRLLRKRPVNVSFTVRAPATARLNAETRNGLIEARAPLAALKADTRNGAILAKRPVGAIEASTRNGPVSAVIADGPLAGDVLLETRNGPITIELPADISANLSLETRHGRVSSDFPLGLDGRTAENMSGTAVLGSGGLGISLVTRNGPIRIERRAPAPPIADSAVVVSVK